MTSTNGTRVSCGHRFQPLRGQGDLCSLGWWSLGGSRNGKGTLNGVAGNGGGPVKHHAQSLSCCRVTGGSFEALTVPSKRRVGLCPPVRALPPRFTSSVVRIRPTSLRTVTLSIHRRLR